jgi:hypothetical protein
LTARKPGEHGIGEHFAVGDHASTSNTIAAIQRFPGTSDDGLSARRGDGTARAGIHLSLARIIYIMRAIAPE